MRTAIFAAILGLMSASATTGCSSDDKATGAHADGEMLCKQLASNVCSQYYSCYTADQLATMSALVGTNESDCVTHWVTQLDCSGNPTQCDAGKTYNADKAAACVDAYEALTCSEFVGFMMGTTPPPAVCDEACK